MLNIITSQLNWKNTYVNYSRSFIKHCAMATRNTYLQVKYRPIRNSSYRISNANK